MGIAAVFDQMYRGFAEIVGREVPEVELHAILGRRLGGLFARAA